MTDALEPSVQYLSGYLMPLQIICGDECRFWVDLIEMDGDPETTFRRYAIGTDYETGEQRTYLTVPLNQSHVGCGRLSISSHLTGEHSWRFLTQRTVWPDMVVMLPPALDR